MFQRLRFLRNIKWHCADWLPVVLRYTIAKYILWCLDKKHYDRCYIFLIACIILLVLFHDTLSEATALFTLIVSMSVTFYSLWKSLTAISFWPNLKIDIFNKHFWTHRMIFWVDISDNQLPDAQRAVLTLCVLLIHGSTAFLSRINRIILLHVMPYVANHYLFVPFTPYTFCSHYSTKRAHHHYQDHHTTFLVVNQNNQEHIEIIIAFFQQLFHISPGSCTG